MAMQNNDSLKPVPLYDPNARLAEISPFAWLLGFGIGGATGLALAYAVYALWIAAPIWIAITALLVATIHGSIIVAFWLNREVVRRKTALMVSMVSSAILTCSLAWMIGANGLQTAPLYGLAFMHLVMAFCHPVHFTIAQRLT